MYLREAVCRHVAQDGARNVKGKVIFLHAMKAYMGSRCIAPVFLNPWHQMEVISHHHVFPAALPPVPTEWETGLV